jgi:hypothetical protein
LLWLAHGFDFAVVGFAQVGTLDRRDHSRILAQPEGVALSPGRSSQPGIDRDDETPLRSYNLASDGLDRWWIMRRLLLVFLFVAMGSAQIEPVSWFQFFGWLQSFNSGDLAGLETFLTRHASLEAQLRHPFILEVTAEMKLRDRVGGGLKMHRIVRLSETEMHVILQGQDGLSWVDADLWVAPNMPYSITAIELHQIPGPPPETQPSIFSESGQPPERDTTVARLKAPQLRSPWEDRVFDHFPRDTTLEWDPVPGAVGYRVQWDYKETDGWASEIHDFRAPSFDTLETSYTFRFVGEQTGRWRVCAFDESGIPGAWSEWRRFRYTR